MDKFSQANNPYAAPLSGVEPEDSEPDDELLDMIKRAYYGATYGTLFFPELAYFISICLLIAASGRRDEFSPRHSRLFQTTLIICVILFFPMAGLILFFCYGMIMPTII